MIPSTVEILQPAFFDAFSCIGPACTDNCCHTWEIDIDKEHYLRYKGEQEPAFRELCSRILLRRKKDATPARYATLALTSEGRCGFQDSDGGCRIYRMLGPTALCHTCTLYPRRKAQFLPGMWEFSLSLSCGEAARLALFSQEQTEFRHFTKEICPHEPVDNLPPLGIGKHGLVITPPSYAPSLRQACIELVRCRLYSIQERILAVGLLLRRVDRILATGGEREIPSFISQFLTSVVRGDFQNFLQRLDYNREAHLAAMQLPVAHILAGARKPVLRHLWIILEPWCRQDPISGEYRAGKEALDFILHEVEAKGDPFLQNWSVPVENYFINYLFSGLFPFLYHSEGFTFEENGILLAEQYALLRILLAISPEKQESSGKERLIEAVVSLSRLCQHSDLGADLAALSHAVKLDGLAHAAYLLR